MSTPDRKPDAVRETLAELMDEFRSAPADAQAVLSDAFAKRDAELS